MKHTYSVSGMTCSGCAATVKKALASVANVEKVEIDLVGGKVEFAMTNRVPLAQLQKSLTSYSYKISEWNFKHNSHLANPINLSNPDPFWIDGNFWKSV